MLCVVAFSSGCAMGSDALFKDVSKRPPLTKAETIDYLIENDRKMAEWVEYQATQCDRHGCI